MEDKFVKCLCCYDNYVDTSKEEDERKKGWKSYWDDGKQRWVCPICSLLPATKYFIEDFDGKKTPAPFKFPKKLNIINLMASGDLMPLETFRNNVEDTCFIDYDGFGYLVTEEQKQSNVRVSPSDLGRAGLKERLGSDNKIRYEGFVFSHILWFNR